MNNRHISIKQAEELVFWLKDVDPNYHFEWGFITHEGNLVVQKNVTVLRHVWLVSYLVESEHLYIRLEDDDNNPFILFSDYKTRADMVSLLEFDNTLEVWIANIFLKRLQGDFERDDNEPD